MRLEVILGRFVVVLANRCTSGEQMPNFKPPPNLLQGWQNDSMQQFLSQPKDNNHR